MAGNLLAFYQGPGVFFPTVVAVGTGGNLSRPPIALTALPGALVPFNSSAYFGAWVRTTSPFITVPITGGFVVLNCITGAVESAISGFGASAGNFPHWNGKKTILSYANTGVEPVDPFGRAGLSPIHYDMNDNTRAIAGPAYTGPDGTQYYYIYALARSPLAPDFAYYFCAPQANSNSDNRAAVARFSGLGQILGGNVIDTGQVNGTTLTVADFLRGQPMVLAPDGSKLFYYHVGVQPMIADFPNVHWMNRVDIQSLTVDLTSQTPFQAGFSGIPPWDQGLAMPVGPFQMSSSQNGRYVFALFPSGNAPGTPKPYILWDTLNNTIRYGQLSDIAGFNWALYSVYSQIFSCFDDEDRLWILIPDVVSNHLWLVKFAIGSGPLLTQMLRVDFSTFDGGQSALMSGLMFEASGVVVSSTAYRTIVSMPDLHYAYSDMLGPKGA